MKKTKVINIISAPSFGKSVCAGLLFSELKIKHFSVEYVQEYVKHLIWKGDLETIKNQYYVSSKQYELLKNVNGKVDFIVTDGSLLHGLYYNKTYTDNVCDISKTNDKILEYISNFDNIFILLEKGDYPFEQCGRIHTFEESLNINKDLKNLLNELNFKYLEIISDKNNIPKMLDYILNY